MRDKIQRRHPSAILRRFVCGLIAILFSLSAPTLAQGDASAETKVVSAPTAPAASVAERSMLPSSLVYYLHAQNYLQPDWKQGGIAAPLLPFARIEGLDEHERFYLAQLNFMAFKGDKAYELFAEFTDRDDWYGWMARMRHAIMDARFFENFERLEQGVKNERRSFRFKPEFSDMPGFGERSLCAHWAETGEHDRAVKLALETMAQTPKDAPYGTLSVVEACYPSFKQTDREAEAFALAQAIVDDLTAALELRKPDQHPAYDATLYDNVIDDWWYHRSVQAPYNYQNHNYEQMIDRVENFLACQRDKVSDACPA